MVVSGDRDGQGPCSFSRSVAADIQRVEFCSDVEDSDGARDLPTVPQVKKRLWGGEFWSDGYFASTVGKHGLLASATLRPHSGGG